MNSNFEKLRDDKGTVLVEIYASWCPHCHNMMPVVEDVKVLLDGRANVYQFDIDKFREFADSLGVESIPTFIVFKNGEEKWRASGELDGNTLVSKVQEYI